MKLVELRTFHIFCAGYTRCLIFLSGVHTHEECGEDGGKRVTVTLWASAWWGVGGGRWGWKGGGSGRQTPARHATRRDGEPLGMRPRFCCGVAWRGVLWRGSVGLNSGDRSANHVESRRLVDQLEAAQARAGPTRPDPTHPPWLGAG